MTDKSPQSAAEYRAYPNHNARCDHCIHFQPPESCEKVEGPINKHGWCEWFEAGKRRGRLYGKRAS